MVAVAVSLVACEKQRSEAVPVPEPTAPASTAEQDALWKLAPDGAVFGMVASSRGVAQLEAAALAVKGVLATAPELAGANRELDAELKRLLGTTRPVLADAGLSHDKGAAAFFTPDGELDIVPLGDRDRFLAVTKGHEGADHDTVDGMACKPVQRYYACADHASLLDRIGKGSLAHAASVAGARGDVEAAGQVPGAGGSTIAFGVVLQLGHGALVARGGVAGLPAIVTSKLGDGGTPRFDPRSTVGFAVFDPRPLLAQVPDAPIVAGVTAHQLAATIAGPITATVSNRAATFDVRVPLSDPGPMTNVVEHCGALVPGATVDHGVCHVQLGLPQVAADAWVEGKVLHLGKRHATAGTSGVALTGAARELATGRWTFAFYGRGTLLGGSVPAVFPAGAALPDAALAGLRGMTLLDELGLGVRRDGDTLRILVVASTVWSNPEAVVAKLLALAPRDVLAGKSADAASAIARSAPRTPFATDLKLGYSGLMIPSAMVGVVSAVAIPAFMQYMKKSKQTEASRHLRELGVNAKAAYLADGAFPEGAALTPGHGCCDQPSGKCQPDAAAWRSGVWQKLGFAISEPTRYQFGYASRDGKTFRAVAIGDLDCDGRTATWTLEGAVDASGHPTVTLTPPPDNAD